LIVGVLRNEQTGFLFFAVIGISSQRLASKVHVIFQELCIQYIDPSKRVDRMKHALAISLLIVVCNAVLSCAPTSILLVNLKTNDLRYCPVGEQSDACIKQLEDLGYIRADRLTPAQKATLGVSLPF
jgi:hypothetical protein